MLPVFSCMHINRRRLTYIVLLKIRHESPLLTFLEFKNNGAMKTAPVEYQEQLKVQRISYAQNTPLFLTSYGLRWCEESLRGTKRNKKYVLVHLSPGEAISSGQHLFAVVAEFYKYQLQVFQTTNNENDICHSNY